MPFIQIINEKGRVNFQPVGGLQHVESGKGEEQRETQ